MIARGALKAGQTRGSRVTSSRGETTGDQDTYQIVYGTAAEVSPKGPGAGQEGVANDQALHAIEEWRVVIVVGGCDWVGYFHDVYIFSGYPCRAQEGSSRVEGGRE